MKRLLTGSALSSVLGLFLFAPSAHADCVTQSGANPVNAISPNHIARYGSFIDLAAHSASNECETYRTDIDSPTEFHTRENGDSFNASSSVLNTYHAGTSAEYDLTVRSTVEGAADLSAGTISTSIETYGNGLGAGASASAEWGDLILIDKPSAAPNENTSIPVTFCSALSSNNTIIGSNATSIGYGDFHYNGHAGRDYLSITGGNNITHTQNGQICRSGFINLNGGSVYFRLKLSGYTIGNQGVDVVQDGNGNNVNITTRDGSIDASFSMTLPAGTTCYSASGNFAGCERPLVGNMMGIAGVDASQDGSTTIADGSVSAFQQCSANEGLGPDGAEANAFVGNPINFALGYKQQTETDYAGGRLSLVRTYRSDSVWTPNSVGMRWRHNFDRSLIELVTPEATTLDLVDASGIRIVFRQNGSTWEAVNGSIRSTLESVSGGGYIYTTTGETVEHYDSAGLLTRIEYRGGEALDFTHDANDRLETVTNEQGLTLTFSYDAQDRVSSVATPTGSFTYSYDASSNLTSVSQPDSTSRTYHYEDTNFIHALTGITDERGNRFADWSYDSEGRAISSEHAGGVDNYTIAYNSDDTTTTTNPLGKQTTYSFETINGNRRMVSVDGHASTNCPAASKSFAYDANGFVSERVDWKGNRITYARNSDGYITSMTEDAGGPDERTTSVTYDANYRLPDVITAPGLTVDRDYDADGRLTSVTVTDSATSASRTTTYSYNANMTDSNGNVTLGRLVSIDGPRTDVSDVTTYTYDSALRLIKTTNALGHEYETISFDSANRPLIVEDANNVQTNIVYDALGRVTSTTRAYGTVDAATTTYAYDNNGNVVTLTDPAGTDYTYVYDAAQRLTSMSDDLGHKIVYTYDNAGNITKEDYENGSGALRYTHSYTFDELSRLIAAVDANNDQTSLTYDLNSNLTQVEDGELNATQFAFDGLDRLVNSTDALSGTTAYILNDQDQATGVTDPRSNTTSYTYNAFDEVLTETSPDRGTLTYTYDSAGNVKTMTDARSITTTYAYDAINRVTSATVPTSSLNASFIYDSGACGYGVGRLCSVSDGAGTTNYSYDVLGRVTSVSEVRGSNTFTTAYSYDASGVLTSMTLPSGRTISYTLNGNGQVTDVSATVNGTTTTLASNGVYLPFGPMSSMTYGNGIAYTASYNTAYQLTSLQHGALLNDAYSYDAAGNITSKGADSYTLDALYRITGENSDSYSYDAIGNRLSGKGVSYSYPSTSSRLSSVGGSSVSLDAAGLMTADANNSYAFDDLGRVASLTGLQNATYSYDANNLRTAKTVGGVTTYYVYGRGGQLYGEYSVSGALIREYVYLNGVPIAQIDAGAPETLTYLHNDHQGAPRKGSDVAGAQVWSWDSDAFGVGAPTGTATVNLRFPGQYYDDESGLYYNWNRYYDPDTGRYISSDPIGLDGGLNTFGYALANAVMYTDPEGLRVAQCVVDGTCSSPPVSGGNIPTRVGGGAGQGVLNACRAAVAGVLDGVFGNSANEEESSQSDSQAQEGEGGSEKPKKTPEDLIDEATPGAKTGGRSRIYDKPGNVDDANKDFDDIVDPDTVEPIPGVPGGRKGKTPDGRNTSVRPQSGKNSQGQEGPPTVQVDNPDGTKTKVRYND